MIDVGAVFVADENSPLGSNTMASGSRLMRPFAACGMSGKPLPLAVRHFEADRGQ
jgi:hypothetical protein